MRRSNYNAVLGQNGDVVNIVEIRALEIFAQT